MSWFPSFKRSSSSVSTSTSITTTSSTDSKSNSKRHQLFRRMSSQPHLPSSSIEEIQHAAIQEASRPTTGRETGFPEPLSPDRNTTLPHPSADTSPNATIIAPDLANPRHSRSRSFLRNHSHSKKNSREVVEIPNGTVTTMSMVDPGNMYEGIEYADGSKESGGVAGVGGGNGNVGVVNTLGSLSAGESSESSGGEKNSMSSEGERDAPEETHKKKGLLRKRFHI